jgi:hypothetical protein
VVAVDSIRMGLEAAYTRAEATGKLFDAGTKKARI